MPPPSDEALARCNLYLYERGGGYLMKWIIIMLELWGDGSYTFMPSFGTPAYSTEQECIEHIKPGLGQKSEGQPAVYTGYVCVPPEVFTNFAMRFRH